MYSIVDVWHLFLHAGFICVITQLFLSLLWREFICCADVLLRKHSRILLQLDVHHGS